MPTLVAGATGNIAHESGRFHTVEGLDVWISGAPSAESTVARSSSPAHPANS
ncbi:hypothetical protein AB0D04_30275 [Streptomyces sp. NPDC048483]|uniref:hypothetical protein n=1 Tax=Streptomyces sp. NPDC048483 TaxID=3154927 RepID=UPI00344931C6